MLSIIGEDGGKTQGLEAIALVWLLGSARQFTYTCMDHGVFSWSDTSPDVLRSKEQSRTSSSKREEKKRGTR